MKLAVNRSSCLLTVGISFLLTIPASAQQECPATPKLGGDCWTTEDVIDGFIDHHAQSAMLRMFAQGGEAAEDASAMLCAVKTRQMEGIYMPNQLVPAKRAVAAGSGWWLIIPRGKNSECYKMPEAQPPLIAFRRGIKDDRDFLAAALSKAWKDRCEIPPAAPRCYIATITKPEPVPQATGDCTEPYQCNTDWDSKKILEICSGYRGSQATGECIQMPDEDCGLCGVDPGPRIQPWCSGKGQCIVGLGYPERCSDGSECLVLPGAEKGDFSCGTCSSSSSEYRDCFKTAWDEYYKDIGVCDDKEKEAAPECVKKMVTCAAAVLGGAASEAFRKCVQSAGCILGGPSHRRFECGGQAETKKSKKILECRKKHL